MIKIKLNKTTLLITSILIVGFLLRIAGVLYGLPQQLDPDEKAFVDAAGRMLSNHSIDPQWYGQPASTLIDLLAFTYALISLIGLLCGHFDSLIEFKDLYYSDATLFYSSGRMITTVFGTACIYLTYKIAKQIVNNSFSILAAVLIATSPAMINYSGLIRPDMLQIFFMLSILYCSIQVVDSQSISKTCIFIIGVLFGCAVSSKYPAVIAFLTIITAFIANTNISSSQKLKSLITIGVISIITAFAISPYLFINFSEVLNDVIGEARPSHLSSTSPGFIMALSRYITFSIPRGLGLFFAALAYIAILKMFFDNKATMLVAISFATYLIFIASLNLWWDRWSLPLMPYAAIGAGYFFHKASLSNNFIRFSKQIKVLLISISCVFLVPNLTNGIELAVNKATNNNNQVYALNWVKTNIPKQSTILLESYTPQASSDDYKIFIAQKGKLIKLSEYTKHKRPPGFIGNIGDELKALNSEEIKDLFRKNKIDYIFIGKFKDRFNKEKQSYARQVKVYENIIHITDKIKSFEQNSIIGSSPISIYKVQKNQ